MLRRNIVGLLICIAAVGVTTLGFAGIPDLDLSSAVMLNAPVGSNVNVYNTPDGSGYLMTEARQHTTPPLSWVDATITVTLLDSGSTPVFAYPFEDIWLESPTSNPLVVDPFDPTIVSGYPGLVACPNGTIADASTDINGQTTFTGPFYAGGHVDYSDDGNDTNDSMTSVMVSGAPLTNGPLQLLFNSADIDGDGLWLSTTDVIYFSAWYPASFGYSYALDYYFDEVNDVSDLVLFSAAKNVSCP